MENEKNTQNRITLLLWSFPATLLIHLAEEYWGGSGFSAHLAKARGVSLSPTRFLLMTAIGLSLMVLGVVLAQRFRFSQWLAVCFGALVLGNGLSHSINGALAREYNPGLISGLLLWIPLGLATLFYLKGKMAGGRYWAALAIGVGIQGIVTLMTLTGGNPLSLLSR